MPRPLFEKKIGKSCVWFDQRYRELLEWSPLHKRSITPDAKRCGVVTMSQLGQLGRFGNWLFQYMFLKCYALEHDLEAQTPHWPGHYLFNCSDPLLERGLPVLHDSHHGTPDANTIFTMDPPVKNVDFAGYFQYHTSFFAPYRSYIQTLLEPRAQLTSGINRAVQRIRQQNVELVAIHLRRGDYGTGKFYITPTSWYLRWLDNLWPTLENPVLYIAADEPDAVVGDFRRYKPVLDRDLELRCCRAPYLIDFCVLKQADILAIPNSTFSFAAAMLNRNLCAAFRSHLSDPLEAPPFRKFDPWNSSVLEFDMCAEEFPGISGIRRAG